MDTQKKGIEIRPDLFQKYFKNTVLFYTRWDYSQIGRIQTGNNLMDTDYVVK